MHTIISEQQIPSHNIREKWHWTKRQKERKAWTDVFIYARLPYACGKRKVKITSYRQRMLDMPNLVGGCKGLIDGLVHSHLLMDDCMSCAEFEYEQSHAKESPTGEACTVVELHDADEKVTKEVNSMSMVTT
jgi:hypothetical protein